MVVCVVQGVGMAVAVTTAGQWPGSGLAAHASPQLALATGQYYSPVAAEALVPAAASAGPPGLSDQLLYAAVGTGAPAAQNNSYQTLDLADSAHHLVAAGQPAEVTIVQSAVLLSHVVCPSVCLSIITLVDHDQIG